MPTNNFKVGEMLNRRTPNSKTWMNFDGSFTTEIHSGIVHYQDENGNLQNINTDLYDEADFDQIDFPVAKDGDSLFYEAKAKAVSDKKKNRLDRDKFDFQGLKVPFDCKIPRNIKRGYSIGKGRSKLSFILVGASSSKGYVEGNKITYPDVWPDTDVVLEMLPTGIKETIILKTNKAPFDFSFEVQGNLEGEMKIQPPWLQDAEGTKRDVVQGVSEVEGKVRLNLAADVSGLVYPIEIDPTVTIQPNETAGKDTFVNSLYPNTNWDGNDYFNFGVDSSTLDISRGLIQFDLSVIPSVAVVTLAKLSLWWQAGYTNIKTFNIHKVTGSWSEPAVTWSNQPSYDSFIEGTWTNGAANGVYESSDVSGPINFWLKTPSFNYGFLIKSPNESETHTRKSVYSSDHLDPTYRPKLVVQYNMPPTAPTVTTPNGGETWNSLHTVAWNAASDPSDIESVTFTPYTDNVIQNYRFAGQVFTNKKNAWLKSFSISIAETIVGSSVRVTLRNAVWNSGAGLYQPGNTVYVSKDFTLSSAFADYLITLPSLIKFAVNTVLVIDVEVLAGNFKIGGAQSNVYADGQGVYYATGRDSYNFNTGSDARVVLNYENAAQPSELKYQIQLTTNNGGSWKDLVALTSPGVTSLPFDFINEPETSLAKIRIRAFDGSAYGPWDESNGVFTIQHNQAPTAPTNLSPSSGTRDRAAVNRLSWQHNDANADPQAKFDLQWRVQGSTTWNDVTQTTVNQFYDAPVNLFPRGTIEWRVRTYDQADLSSPYSVIATFFAGDKPAVPTIVSPGSTVAVANPTVQWSSTDQTGFLLTVKDSTGITVFSKERNSTNKAETITYSLENQQDYTIELKIKNADDLYSDAAVLNISVSYTPPAIPDVETVKGNSFIQINIIDLVPTGTQPAVLYHDIYKQIEGEFVLIATGIQGEYKDYQVASNENVRYFVRSQGDNETFIDTSIFTESVSFRGVWLHIVDDKENTIYQFKFDGDGRSSNWGVESAMHRFQGRKNPVIETGEMQEYSVEFSLKIENELERIALERITFSQQTVCYRDGRGRKVFGVFVEVPLTDERWGGYSTSLSLMKIDFKEEIE